MKKFSFGLKFDIEKAYNTLCWSFLRVVFPQFGFSIDLIDRIMLCVTSTSFSQHQWLSDRLFYSFQGPQTR